MNIQGPMMQGMMGNYIEQSKNLFVQMQEQMQNQTLGIFTTFPFNPDIKPKYHDKIVVVSAKERPTVAAFVFAHSTNDLIRYHASIKSSQ